MTNPTTSNTSPDLLQSNALETTSETLVRALPETPLSNADATDENDRLKLQLLTEEIAVSKGVRQMGEVTISKRIVEEVVQVPVTLRREEVTMTRRDVSLFVETGARLDLQEGEHSDAFTEQTIVIRTYEEVPHITKTTRVSGEVEISKRVVSRDKNLAESVRHEEVDVKAPDNIVVIDEDKPQ